MKNYVLFLVEDYEAEGGWRDMACMGSLEACQAFAKSVFDNPVCKFDRPERVDGHIVDLEQGVIVLKLRCTRKYAHLPVYELDWVAP